MTQKTMEPTQRAGGHAGKYLTFLLGGEAYGLPILKVREIIGMMDVTSVPRMPAFIKGVINLRGRVIPVMDLRTKFGMPQGQRTAATCIVVVYVGRAEMGVIVDGVSEVLDIAAGQIEETPSFGVSVDTSFILGIGQAARGIVMLLNVDKVLTAQEAEAIQPSQA